MQTIHHDLVAEITNALPDCSIGTLTNVLRVIERFEPTGGRQPNHYRVRAIDRGRRRPEQDVAP